MLTACNGGSGSSSNQNNNGNNPNNNSGGNTSLNITALKTLGSTLSATYTPTCIYNYGGTTYVINGDGSGTGVSLNINTGAVQNQTNLPVININNGDTCLDNFGQLTWFNKSNTSIIKVIDPNNNSNSNIKTIDLSTTGISGATISTTSYSYIGSNNELFANDTFLNNGDLGFSIISLNGLPTAKFNPLDNSTYIRTGNKPVYGFNGLGSTFIQLLQADGNLPAILTAVQGVPNSLTPPIQTIQTITDKNQAAIPEMSTAWDFASTGSGDVVLTGAVQPILYNCPGSKTVQNNFTCTQTYTSSELTTKYRIMRLLGASSTTVYFMGMDLAKSEIDIFSMPL